MFAYCENNPVNLFDPNGQDPVSIATIGLLAIVAVGLIATVTTSPPIQKEFSKFGDALTSTITSIGDAFSSLISKAKAKIKSKAEEKEKDITAPPKQANEYNYWEADRIKDNIVVGKPLTVQEAAYRVSTGKSIICKNQEAAKHIIYINGYVNAVGPERHKGGYYHYHPTRNHTGYDSIHIWFYQ